MRSLIGLPVLMAAVGKSGSGGAAHKADEPKMPEPKADEPDTTQVDNEVGSQILRKLNPKDIMGAKIKDLPIPSDLYTIIGRAANLRDGESAYGPWTSLRGEFEAVRLTDGQRFISSECFVPGPAGDLLVSQVRKFILEPVPATPEQIKKVGQTYKVTGDYVEMALVISTKKSDRDGGAPYEFVVRPIVPVQKADPLAALREKLVKALPKLPAPPKSGS